MSTLPACYYAGNRRLVSEIPGNIGIVRAQVIIWENDPFMARPHTSLSFSCNEQSGREGKDEPMAEFVAGAVTLRPIYYFSNMFVATSKSDSIPTETVEESQISNYLDFVGSTQSGTASPTADYLPGGSEYSPADFQHQLWIHKGSLFARQPVRAPSEYDLDYGQTKYWGTSTSSDADKSRALANYVRWEMSEEVDGMDSTLWPYQASKQSPGEQWAIHWTLEKYTKVWQGCDFFVLLKKGDKTLDVGTDPCLDEDIEGNLIELDCNDEKVETVDHKYKCLFYKLYGSATTGNAYSGTGPSTTDFIQGISNQAYTYPTPTEADVDLINAGGGMTTLTDEINKAQAKSRRDFWWLYKPYLLIEIGPNSDKHNYFIELVAGRSPRFIHIGWEYTNVNPQESDETNDNWMYVRKSRVLSTYSGLTSDALLNADQTRISVRNFMGKIIIQFQGYEANPWIIQRQDIVEQQDNPKRIAIPMVVPSDKIRLHGGNMSCKLGFCFTKYNKEADIFFDDIQCDTYNADSSDLYITLTEMGQVYGAAYPTSNVMSSHFGNDPKLGPSTMTPTVDSDVAISREYIKNAHKNLNVYQKFKNSISLWGRGYTSANNQFSHIFGGGHKLTFLKGIPSKKPVKAVSSSFTFGRSDPDLADYDYKDYSSTFNVVLRLTSGHIRMPYDGEAWSGLFGGENPEPKTFTDVLSPVVTQWRFLLTGGEKATENIVPFDISPLVTNLTDHWTAEEYTTLNHDATLKCYLPIGIPLGTPATTTGTDPNLLSLAQQLWRLHDKAFYVTIKYWWGVGVGLREAVGNVLNGPQLPEFDPVLIQMTGIAFGGEFERSVNKMFMNIKIKDYMEVFRKQYMFNSPFFDGVMDTLAVYEIAKLAGFDDDPNPPPTKLDRRPLSFLSKVMHHPDWVTYAHNGVKSQVRPYRLPAGYADLSNPTMRFQNGETYDSCLKKITQLAGKTIYFDQYGVLKYENNPAYEAAFAPPGTSASSFVPIYRFVTSPLVNIPPSTSDGGGSYLNDGFVFNPKADAARLVYNVIRYGRAVEDCINTIVLMTASKDIFGVEDVEHAVGGYIVEGHTFMDQIWDPTAEGFLGFRKAFYQSNGVFGGLQELRKTLLHYAKMKYPPTYVTFETYGIPGLKALDIVTLDNELFYITDISHEINPQENKWWMTIQGEWFKPFRGDTSIFGEPDVTTIPPS